MGLVDQAREFMIKAHEGQKRWDGRPYSVHPKKVVNILEKYFGVDVEEILCAAYLHDVLEDTKITEKEIEEKFGWFVARLVKELTFKPENGSTKEYVELCNKLGFSASLIKIADILANITDEGHKTDHFIRKRVAALKVLLK